MEGRYRFFEDGKLSSRDEIIRVMVQLFYRIGVIKIFNDFIIAYDWNCFIIYIMLLIQCMFLLIKYIFLFTFSIGISVGYNLFKENSFLIVH